MRRTLFCTLLTLCFAAALPAQQSPHPAVRDIDELTSGDGWHAVRADSLPANFPSITAQVFDSTALGEGYIFLAVAADVEGVGYYLMILENDGTPLWYHELADDYAYDFKVQPNGRLTYAHFFEHHDYTGGGNVTHMIMDHDFNIIDSVQMGNGYVAEAHDFQMLPNGHCLLFGYYLTRVDLSDIVDGGYPNALVSGGVVQELDAERNVVFQWRSWDHYSFEDYDYGRFGSRSTVSAFHLNTINLDIDGNIILATPVWTKKINRANGEIMWHLGGDENEFSFVGVDSAEAVGHFGGHTIHRIPNGNFLIYDNGDRRGNRTSRVWEYQVDEENKVATLVWGWEPEEMISGWHRGSAQRLPNGNTFIGWGGGRGDLIPACTEVTPDGDRVFELFFDNAEVESYRAFRLPLPDGQPCADVVEFEVSSGLAYEFRENEKNDTGVEVKINSLGGSGYNEMYVKKYCFAPLNPSFTGRAPRVLPLHAAFTEYNISGIDAELRFDAAKWDIDDPENTTVYWRAEYGTGVFTPVQTTCNSVTGKVVADVTEFGEYILAAPDVPLEVHVPMPYAPDDEGTVNQTLSATLEWNPVGLVESFALQVATDAGFGSPIVDVQDMSTGRYELSSLDADAIYYWRVRATNEAGQSDWCETQSFRTVAPYVDVTVPDGGEQWQRGLEHFIEWDDNIEEDVILALYRGEDAVMVLDTAESLGAWLWDIPSDLETGEDYTIRMTAHGGASLSDVSAAAFSIIDTTTEVEPGFAAAGGFVLYQNYPNPFNPSTRIRFDLRARAQVTLTVRDLHGRQVAVLSDGEHAAGTYVVEFDGADLPSGAYTAELRTGGILLTRRMMLVK